MVAPGVPVESPRGSLVLPTALQGGAALVPVSEGGPGPSLQKPCLQPSGSCSA